MAGGKDTAGKAEKHELRVWDCRLSTCQDIIVERIKNRFDPAYDATTSAGYRDVALNLRIVTRRTKVVGIHTHICEVQLILLGFFNLKSAEGHKRDVTFRNLRAE